MYNYFKIKLKHDKINFCGIMVIILKLFVRLRNTQLTEPFENFTSDIIENEIKIRYFYHSFDYP